MKPPFAEEEMAPQRQELTNELPHFPDTLYGAATDQIALLQGQRLHEAGFRGEGMTIAVIDAGFHNADRMEALRGVKIWGCDDTRLQGFRQPRWRSLRRGEPWPLCALVYGHEPTRSDGGYRPRSGLLAAA